MATRGRRRTDIGARRAVPALVVAAALLVAACSGDDEDDADDADTTATSAPTDTTVDATDPGTTEPDDGDETTATTIGPAGPADPELFQAILEQAAAEPAGCDALDTRQCLLPFPSDAATVPDDATSTGVRVAFPDGGLPSNVDGVPIDPAEWNRNDGFSPNTPILTHVPGLDAEASGLPSWTDIGASLADDATVVVVDVDTGERVPLWAEPSVADDPDEVLLVVQPAVRLTEGHRYAVGLRGLVATDGAAIEPTPLFRAYRDGIITQDGAIEARRGAMDAAIQALDEAGVARDELQLAWSFTVATTESITGRMLHLRDETLAALGDGAPAFTVDEVVEGEDGSGIARRVNGTFKLTNWLTGDGSPGNRFHYGGPDGTPTAPDDLPTPNGTLRAAFTCNIPDATLFGFGPSRPPAYAVQYGHGLLGSEREIDARNVRNMSNEHNAVYCATKWAGMSEDDIPNAVAILQEISAFPSLADRLQQGILNQLVLSRLMLAPDGLTSHPAFQFDDGTPLLDTSALHFDGNSQGGIMGLALAGVSTDIERFVLGVPGMNYSMLLPRSIDFDTYLAVFEPAYPSPLERELIIAAIQMLWDRGEGAGYVAHVVDDPLPGTTPKRVLLHVALGDHQVTELSAMVEARTMGIPVHRPVTADGRSLADDLGWGLDELTYAPTDGSAIVVWDSGAAPIPFERTPPREGEDPHGDPRNDPLVRIQKGGFLFQGTLVPLCDGPCVAEPDS